MRCQDIERILIEGVGDAAGDLERHLASCPACAAFQADLARIRGHFRVGMPPVLPPALDARTKAAWRSDLMAPRPAPLPRWLWAALAVLTALTAVIVYPIFADPEIFELLSFRTAAGIALLMQNGLMLFFAPILLRTLKRLPGASRFET
jgi:hypothetical protein